jgi:hypothetical protein
MRRYEDVGALAPKGLGLLEVSIGDLTAALRRHHSVAQQSSLLVGQLGLRHACSQIALTIMSKICICLTSSCVTSATLRYCKEREEGTALHQN